MEPIHLSDSEAIIWFAGINAAVSFALGIIPLCFGFFLKKKGLGITAIFTATAVGAIFGIYLSLPLIAVFMWLIITDKRVRIWISSAVFLLGVALGVLAFIRASVGPDDTAAAGPDPVLFIAIIGGAASAAVGVVLLIFTFIQFSGKATESGPPAVETID